MPGTRRVGLHEIRQLVDYFGTDGTVAHFSEALNCGDLRYSDFSIRELAEGFVGRNWVATMTPGHSGGYQQTMAIFEAGDAVAASDFSNITGQVVYNKLLDAFTAEEFVFSKVIPTVPTEFNGEKIPGISRIGDEAETVGEGEDFPLVGVGEDWITTPVTVKRGMIIPLTREAIFFDRTGLLTQRAGQIGNDLGLNKEKRVINMVIDENTTTHRYTWRDTVIATYGNNSGDHTWDNLEASNALVDISDIEKSELLLAAITDPNTGEPVVIDPTHLVVQPDLVHTAKRIVNATNIRVQAGGFATSGDLLSTDSPNPLNQYQIISSRQLKAQTATDSDWWFGALTKLGVYMENWPISVTPSPADSHDAFHRDIVSQWRADERGATATLEPRVMAENTA